MEAVLIIVVFIVVIAIVLVARAVKIVPQSRAGIVLRLGRYNRTLQPGLNLVMPFVDQVRLVDMAERTAVLQPVRAHTDDNQSVAAEGVVTFQVTSPETATFQTTDPDAEIKKFAARLLREAIAKETLQSVLASRATINDPLRDALVWQAGNWGIRIHRVDVTFRAG